MRYLGIDFGSKRVGVAVSDETSGFALPVSVLLNNSGLIAAVKKIIAEKNVVTIVLGESKNFKGEDNAIMAAIREFKKTLEIETGLPVVFEPEFMTSAQAARPPAREVRNPERKVKVEKNKSLDASAAAIILQSYIDKIVCKY